MKKETYLVTAKGQKRIWYTISNETAQKIYEKVPQEMKLIKTKHDNPYDEYAYKVAMNIASIAGRLDGCGLLKQADSVDLVLQTLVNR